MFTAVERDELGNNTGFMIEDNTLNAILEQLEKIDMDEKVFIIYDNQKDIKYFYDIKRKPEIF